MKKLILMILCGSMSASMMAQTFDDIYYNPKKEKKSPKSAQTYTPERQSQKYDFLPADLYDSSQTSAFGNTRDVDEYNRRGIFSLADSTSNAIDSEKPTKEFEYTDRIRRFYNPDVAASDTTVTNYFASDDYNINIIVANPGYYGYWGVPYYYNYDPFYWSPWGWSSYWGPAWGSSWAWGYGPVWRPAWSWGWDNPWSWGYPTWGWGASWGWGGYPGHHPGHHPGHGPGGNKPNYGYNPVRPSSGQRPTADGYRPGSGRYPANNGSQAVGSGRSPGLSSGGSHGVSVENQNRPQSVTNNHTNSTNNGGSYTRPGRNGSGSSSFNNGSSNRSNNGGFSNSGGFSRGGGGGSSRGGGRGGRH